MDATYKGLMDIESKRRLAWTGEIGKAACAVRLRAARALTGLNQRELSLVLKMRNSTNLNSMENGVTFPTREVMRYFYEEHRIDFNFLVAGEYNQLPGDVQERLFPALEAANNEWDEKENSDRDAAKRQFSQS